MPAWDWCKDWTAEDHAWLRAEVPKTALDTPFRGGTVGDVAREVVAIAKAGLAGARRGSTGTARTSATSSTALEQIAADGRTPAEEKLERFRGPGAARSIRCSPNSPIDAGLTKLGARFPGTWGRAADA